MQGDLRTTLLELFRSDDELSSLPIEVDVEADVVTLRGEVQSHRRMLRAQELAAGVVGAVRVRNDLRVESVQNPTDEEVAAAVRTALEEHHGVAKPSILVQVGAGRVTLSGSVASEAERLLASDLALRAPGALEVRNQLAIDAPGRMEAAVVAREVEHELARDPRLAGADVRFAVSGDVGILSGTVPADDLRFRAEEVVRSFWTGALRNELRVEG